MIRRIPGVAISCLLLLAVAAALASCGSDSGGGTSTAVQATTQTVTTLAASTETATTGMTTESATSTTTDWDSMPMTTSVALGMAAGEGADLVRRLGDAIISYLDGKGDLGALQALVAPSAQEGLARMLSSLDPPTSCKVWGISNYNSSNESEVDLLFAGGANGPTHVYVTVLADPDTATVSITAVDLKPRLDPWAPATTTLSTPVTTILDAGTGGSTLPVIQIQVQPELEYMGSYYSYFTAEAVVLAKVVEVLPLRRNPPAGTGDPGGPNGPQPIVYKGYVLEVEKAYGPESIPKRITVYALGNGTVEVDGVTYEVRVEFPLDVRPGDRLFAPLTKVAYFGTPELTREEYWVQANLAVYAVEDDGRCIRVTGADIDPEAASEFPLSSLEEDALAQGKEPSRVE